MFRFVVFVTVYSPYRIPVKLVTLLNPKRHLKVEIIYPTTNLMGFEFGRLKHLNQVH